MVQSTLASEVSILPCVAPETVASLAFSPSLQAFRPAEHQQKALVQVAGMPGSCVSLAVCQQVVGYSSIRLAEAGERWRVAGEWIYELGAIEVAPDFRKRHLASRLLGASFAGGKFEELVVIARIYVWHFDLANTGLLPHQYRQLLLNLYRKFGFIPLATDDPEIMRSSENLFMARIGSRLSQERIEEFYRILFVEDSHASA